MEEFAAVDSHNKQTTGSQVWLLLLLLLLFCSGKGGEDYLDLILLAFAVFLRGFEDVTYLYYRCERERALVVVVGEEEIDLSCGRNKK
jgi:hypothetical protein